MAELGYCTDPDCKSLHCRWGSQGEKRYHFDSCSLKHCYSCLSHKLLLDENGTVTSWYCPPCQQRRTLNPEPEPNRKLTIAEIQMRLRIMATKAKVNPISPP